MTRPDLRRLPASRTGDNGSVNAIDFQIVKAGAEDAGEILTLQRAAYQSEAVLYHDPALPPLVQTLPELVEELAGSVCLKAVVNHRIVGSVRGRVDGRTGHVGRLIVAPDLQGNGIGTRLIVELERILGPEVDRYEIFTGDRSTGNIAYYTRMGYRECWRERLGNDLILVYMDKPAR
jgi:ribosomal protein S18 acetylase RimI-like enzyme